MSKAAAGAEPVASGTVSAASRMEKERPNAELYAKLCIWSHHLMFMGLDGTDRSGTLPGEETYEALRRNANLNDIACAVRSEVFREFRYKKDYAEDLDLGVRMLRVGHSLGFLSSEQVIHSHRRKPYYAVKRAYVDQVNILTILPDMPISEIDRPGLFARVLNGYGQWGAVKGWVDGLPDDEISLDEFDARMDNFFVMAEFFEYREPSLSSGDSELDGLLNQVWQLAKDEPYPSTGLVDRLQYYYANHISVFLRRTQRSVTREDRLEVMDSLLKHYAVHVGLVFFNYTRQGPP